MKKEQKYKNRLIPTVSILGVNVAAIDMNWLLKYTTDHINEMRGEYICVSNVHTTVLSYENQSYRDVQNEAVIVIPDGGPLSFVGRRRGACNMKRTTGPDYMEEIFKASLGFGWKHYFYGSTPMTIDALKERLTEGYPNLQVVGVFSPPFREMSMEEDERICQEICKASPDFVWVGLGAPKQEMWMASHRGRFNGVMVGVGAAFDYHAGNIIRAPLWMQRMNILLLHS